MADSTLGVSGIRTKKVLIVDDHPIVCRGLEELLVQEPDIEICGGASSVSDALREVEVSKPDLVVVDILLRDSHGLDLITQIGARYVTVKTLAWSMFDEQVFALRALRAGAMGYVNKREPIERVLDAIRKVLGGDIYLSSRMTNQLLLSVSRDGPLVEDPIQRLSNRELEVFEMIGQGKTTKQIARHLDLSPKTIEAHREHIKTKLELRNAAELSRRAVLWAMGDGRDHC
jgi:DNA-binding NarL/FixJ family response regulator